ncbi:MAG TPA: hypothetical protein VGG20_22520 [Thermoanaerobaculia bacterium]|jgi:ATP-dependent Lhr-like helicase
MPPSSSSAEAWPDAESPDELHDALLTLGFVTAEEGARSGWERLFDALAMARRATRAALAGGSHVWIAAERLPLLLALHPAVPLAPAIAAPPRFARDWTAEEALVELVRGRLDGAWRRGSRRIWGGRRRASRLLRASTPRTCYASQEE